MWQTLGTVKWLINLLLIFFFVNVKIGGVKLTLSCIQKCEGFFPAQVSDIVLVAKLLIIAIYVI